MAPRKPAKPPLATPATPVAKRAAVAPVEKPTSACGCGGCAPTVPGLCRMLVTCPLGKHLCTRSFWAASVVAFLVIFASDWLINSHFLVADYVATSAFWRAEGDIRSSLLVLTQAVTAMAYAAIVLGMGHATRWWGSLVSGVMAAVPVAMVSVNTYAMMPFAESTIPAAWALTALLQGGLVGVAICATLKASRAPETHTDCTCGCGDTCTCKPKTLH